MARSELFPLADRAVGGRLAVLLNRYRETEPSLRAIAQRLADDHGIDVSHETVRRWLVEVSEPTDGEAAEAAG